MTFHTQVVGANGQRQAMFIERTPGLAEVILSNFRFGPDDVMMVFSASGLTAVPVEMARGAKARGMRVIAVTSVAQSMSAEPEPAAGQPPAGGRRSRDRRLLAATPTPSSTIEGLDTPVGPGSTVGAVAIVNAIKVRTAELLVERGAMPPVITRASAWAPSGRGPCSTKPIESMRGGSPVRSTSKEVGDEASSRATH